MSGVHGKTKHLLRGTWLAFLHSSPRIFIAFVCLYGSSWIIPKIYYSIAPGPWWVSLTEPVHISNGPINQDLTLKFCRKLRHDKIDMTISRSFYRIENGKQSPAGSYTDHKPFQDKSEKCNYPVIKASNLPKVAGTYTAYTNLSFDIEGKPKELGYGLDQPFTISDTRDSLQNQIEQLKQQIQDLERRQPTEQSSKAVPQTLANQPVSVAQAVIPPVNPVRQSTQSTRPTTPPSSSPPNPPTPAAPLARAIAVVPPAPSEPVDPMPQEGGAVRILQNATGTITGLIRNVL